jgi:hypothetical protein
VSAPTEVKRDVWADLREAMDELREKSRLLDEATAEGKPSRPSLTLIQGGRDAE